ncbi:Protein disulfide-isomerase [Colletotrichum orbiculare MAFF 240422]|uniref:Protein disulfide-isomerase n=1 Tax=Colletotrichum orbiculare (strain 104-T / ATCC 96160 / CBS 514.97 / LARS 414 / MAFF 240422) TaxID=1213857 RepID=A0A484FI51_COLOR|nr:Protein disulfide-isomerase [Colletotrichum orbiculare MAFF 240422]
MCLKLFVPLLALVGASRGWQHKTADQVRSAIETNDYALVAFVMPNSPRCEALDPHWANVEDAIPAAVSIDCSSHYDFCLENDVASYPAIRFMRPDGTNKPFRGTRKGSEIGNFVNRMLRPVITRVEKTTLSSFRSSDDVVAVAQFTPEETSLRDRFAELAEKLHDRHAFGLQDAAEGPGKITCWNNAIGAMQMSTQLEAVDAMEELVKRCAAPLVPRLTRRNEVEHLNSGKSLVYFFARVEDYLEAWTEAVLALAKKYHEYMTFVTVDLNEYPTMPASFGFPNEIEDAVALQNPATGQVYPYAGEITVDAVEEFINSISDGKVEPWDGVSLLQLVEVDEQGHTQVIASQAASQAGKEAAGENKPKDKAEKVDERTEKSEDTAEEKNEEEQEPVKETKEPKQAKETKKAEGEDVKTHDEL